jgi:hypothetical protein
LVFISENQNISLQNLGKRLAFFAVISGVLLILPLCILWMIMNDLEILWNRNNDLSKSLNICAEVKHFSHCGSWQRYPRDQPHISTIPKST